MKLKLEKVIRPLDLGGYAEEMKGQIVHVWVNPDRATFRRHELMLEKHAHLLGRIKTEGEKSKGAAEAAREKIAEQVKEYIEEFNEFALNEFVPAMDEWYALIWSQNADTATHWTAEELVQLREADPALEEWMRLRTRELIEEHRVREKKG